MKDENRHCYNCLYYKPFYTKEYTHFDKLDRGLCMRTKDVEKRCVCERWAYNNEFNRRLKKQYVHEAVFKAVNEVTKNLTEISQILREEQDDNV